MNVRVKPKLVISFRNKPYLKKFYRIATGSILPENYRSLPYVSISADRLPRLMDWVSNIRKI